MNPPVGAPSRRRRRRVAAALALLVAVAVVVALVLLAGSPPPASPASANPSGSVTVSRRDLVQTDTESGTVGYSDPQTVYDRLSGTITWLPAVGQRIGRGQALFRVDGSPVPLLYGATPAYRSLGPDDSAGPDVEQLNANLVALGFNPGGIVVDDLWQPATTLGVQQFQAAMGGAETGVLPLGEVVFLPGAQLVASLDGTVGATSGGGSGAGGSAAAASTVPGSARSEFVGLVVGLGPAGRGHKPTRRPPPAAPPKAHPRPPDRELAALTALLKAQSAQLRAEAAQLRAQTAQLREAKAGRSARPGSTGGSGGGTDSATGGAAGGGGASPTAVLETTSEHLVVTVDLPASAQSEAQVGETVTVQLPNGSTVAGRIAAVSRIAQNSSASGGSGGSGGGSASAANGGGGSGGSGSSSTVPVTISLHGHLPAAGLDQAAVSVNFAQQRANHVLSVPVTALLAVPGGSYDLQEATAPHHLIPVQTGLFAAGYVQVSGPGVFPGLAVTASQG